MLNGSKIGAVKEEGIKRIVRLDLRMIGLMHNASVRNKRSSGEKRSSLGLANVKEVVSRNRV